MFRAFDIDTVDIFYLLSHRPYYSINPLGSTTKKIGTWGTGKKWFYQIIKCHGIIHYQVYVNDFGAYTSDKDVYILYVWIVRWEN